MNIAEKLKSIVASSPLMNATLFVIPDKKSYDLRAMNFKELEENSNIYANYFLKEGIISGQKIIVSLEEDESLYQIIIGLLKIGAVPVITDKITHRSYAKLVENIEVHGVISSRVGPFDKRLFNKVVKQKNHIFTTQSISFGKTKSLYNIKDNYIKRFLESSESMQDTFMYRWDHINQKLESMGIESLISFENNIIPKEVGGKFCSDSIFLNVVNLINGKTYCKIHSSLFKTLELARKINKELQVETIYSRPENIKSFSKKCIEEKSSFLTIKNVYIISNSSQLNLFEIFQVVFPNAVSKHIYSSQALLPLSSIKGKFAITKTKDKTLSGQGSCLGYSFTNIEFKIKPINEHEKKTNPSSLIVEKDVGVICFKQLNQKQWIETDDLGYIDDEDKLWLCGKKEDRVESIFGQLNTIQCEAIFDSHPDVEKSTLVGVGQLPHQVPNVLIFPKKGRIRRMEEKKQMLSELRKMARLYPHTKNIENIIISNSINPLRKSFDKNKIASKIKKHG